MVKIVLTGGPGAGKTTAMDLFHRELHKTISIVPEAATLLFSGGFPRPKDPRARCLMQKAIYNTQINLEELQENLRPEGTLLCDRGTADSAAYWPQGQEEFFNQLNTSLEQELGRYSAVVFFQSAAVADLSIEGGNPYRLETNQEAAQIDASLMKVWEKHPKFYFVAHQESFIEKVKNGIDVLRQIIAKNQHS